MLAVPTKALLITLGSNPYFLNAKITPKAVEKRENNTNFKKKPKKGSKWGNNRCLRRKKKDCPILHVQANVQL